MPLPAPRLDDRSFQDLVDDAKRLLQQRCPQWTDHNVSDPGVTLIELFAWMTDIMLYRLNRVPDRLYVKFLELIGVSLFPPTAARTDVTFRLTAPQPAVVRVPPGTQVGTRRSDEMEPVLFTTTEDLEIPPCELGALATAGLDGTPYDRTATAGISEQFHAFSDVPQPGESLLIGLSVPTPRCVVALRFDCHIEGHGVDPKNPPLEWEAWTGRGWERCELESDDTGGLNRAGDVLIHIPRGHTTAVMASHSAAWLRCRVTPSVEGQPPYSNSPKIQSVAAHTIGGTVNASHAVIVESEELGAAIGAAGERFTLARRPVVRAEPPATLSIDEHEWMLVDDFAGSDADDRVFSIDWITGEVILPPEVRLSDGTMRRYGQVPRKSATVTVKGYRSGGGSAGNVAAQTLTVVKSSIPFVKTATNRRPAIGGVDGETIDEAKLRGPLALRARDRALTVSDYELLARQAAPEVGRVAAVAAKDQAGVRVLVVPRVPEFATYEFADLVPAPDLLAAIARYLEERRMVGARIVVEPPIYQGVTVVAALRARRGGDTATIEAEGRAALHRLLHPLVGGPDGAGWPFGRPVHMGEIYAVLQRVAGVELVEDVKLFAADPVSGRRGEPARKVELAPNALVYGYGHVIRAGGA